MRQGLAPEAQAAVFAVRLPAGPTYVQTWFYDQAGNDLGGAFYVYVRFVDRLQEAGTA